MLVGAMCERTTVTLRGETFRDVVEMAETDDVDEVSVGAVPLGLCMYASLFDAPDVDFILPLR